jgi:hypothetical protein
MCRGPGWPASSRLLLKIQLLSKGRLPVSGLKICTGIGHWAAARIPMQSFGARFRRTVCAPPGHGSVLHHQGRTPSASPFIPAVLGLAIHAALDANSGKFPPRAPTSRIQKTGRLRMPERASGLRTFGQGSNRTFPRAVSHPMTASREDLGAAAIKDVLPG